MAGFPKEGRYHCIRGNILLPLSIQQYERKLLPRLSQYRAQSQGIRGDRSSCCDKFLNHIVPWLIQVLIQDGVFFICDFPDHPVSNLLKNQINGYDRWAMHQRRWVHEKEQRVEADRIAALNNAAREAFENLLTRQIHVEQQLQGISVLIAQVKHALEQRLIADVTENNQVENQPGRQPHQVQEQPPIGGQRRSSTTVAEESKTGTETSVVEQRTEQNLPASTPIPAFDTSLPKNMVVLFNMWNDRGLELFRGRNQRDWPSNTKQAYNKFLYLVDTIKERAVRMGTTEAAAAVSCDAERRAKGLEGRSVYKYWKWLKEQDSNVVRRRKRRRSLNNETEQKSDSDSDLELNLTQFSERHATATATRPSVVNVHAQQRRVPVTERTTAAPSQRTMFDFATAAATHRQQRQMAMRPPPRQLPQTIGPQFPTHFVNLATHRPHRPVPDQRRWNSAPARGRRGRLTVIDPTVAATEDILEEADGERQNTYTSGGRYRMTR